MAYIAKACLLLVMAAVILFVESGIAIAQSKPGILPYTPTRIEWLATVLQAQLRQDLTEQNGFLLQIVNQDHETILIYARYLPTVNREVMNMAIQTAREVTMITAKGYGWEKWVKIREDIQMSKPDRR